MSRFALSEAVIGWLQVGQLVVTTIYVVLTYRLMRSTAEGAGIAWEEAVAHRLERWTSLDIAVLETVEQVDARLRSLEAGGVMNEMPPLHVRFDLVVAGQLSRKLYLRLREVRSILYGLGVNSEFQSRTPDNEQVNARDGQVRELTRARIALIETSSEIVKNVAYFQAHAEVQNARRLLADAFLDLFRLR